MNPHPMSQRRRPALAAMAALLLAPGLPAQAQDGGCPGAPGPRPAGTLLSVHGAGDAPQALNADALSALPATQLTQRQTVSGAGAATGPGSERSTVWSGVLLRDVLLQAGFGGAQDRGARGAVVEALASDGYRALFSWGELFNHPAGEQVLVVRGVDGRALDAQAGPLALRALADLRPGPRHVRNLCAVRIVR